MDWEVFKNGALINTIHSDEAFCKAYCAQNGYEYRLRQDAHPEEDSTQQDDIDSMLVDHEYRLTLLELNLNGGDE